MGKVMAMVILGYVICFALGACIGLLIAGICTNASENGSPDKAETKEKDAEKRLTATGEEGTCNQVL